MALPPSDVRSFANRVSAVSRLEDQAGAKEFAEIASVRAMDFAATMARMHREFQAKLAEHRRQMEAMHAEMAAQRRQMQQQQHEMVAQRKSHRSGGGQLEAQLAAEQQRLRAQLDAQQTEMLAAQQRMQMAAQQQLSFAQQALEAAQQKAAAASSEQERIAAEQEQQRAQEHARLTREMLLSLEQMQGDQLEAPLAKRFEALEAQTLSVVPDGHAEPLADAQRRVEQLTGTTLPDLKGAEKIAETVRAAEPVEIPLLADKAGFFGKLGLIRAAGLAGKLAGTPVQVTGHADHLESGWAIENMVDKGFQVRMGEIAKQVGAAELVQHNPELAIKIEELATSAPILAKVASAFTTTSSEAALSQVGQAGSSLAEGAVAWQAAVMHRMPVADLGFRADAGFAELAKPIADVNPGLELPAKALGSVSSAITAVRAGIASQVQGDSLGFWGAAKARASEAMLGQITGDLDQTRAFFAGQIAEGKGWLAGLKAKALTGAIDTLKARAVELQDYIPMDAPIDGGQTIGSAMDRVASDLSVAEFAAKLASGRAQIYASTGNVMARPAELADLASAMQGGAGLPPGALLPGSDPYLGTDGALLHPDTHVPVGPDGLPLPVGPDGAPLPASAMGSPQPKPMAGLPDGVNPAVLWQAEGSVILENNARASGMHDEPSQSWNLTMQALGIDSDQDGSPPHEIGPEQWAGLVAGMGLDPATIDAAHLEGSLQLVNRGETLGRQGALMRQALDNLRIVHNGLPPFAEEDATRLGELSATVPGPPLTEQEAALIGTALDPNNPPDQGYWNEFGVNVITEAALQQGLITQAMMDNNWVLAGNALGMTQGNDPSSTPQQLTLADLAALARDSGISLAGLDASNLTAATNYVNGEPWGAHPEQPLQSLGEQRERLRKALNKLAVLSSNGMPNLSDQQAKDLAWNAGKVGHDAVGSVHGSERSQALQDIALSVSNPGQHEFKIGKYNTTITVSDNGTVSETECKKPGFFGKLWNGIKKVGKVALTVASVIPSPIQPLAVAANAIVSGISGFASGDILGGLTGLADAFVPGVGRVVNAARAGIEGLKNGNILGGLAGLASAVSSGAGALAGKTAAAVSRIAGGISTGLRTVQNGLAGLRRGGLGGFLTGAAGIARGVAQGLSGFGSDALQGITNRLNDVSQFLSIGASGYQLVGAGIRGGDPFAVLGGLTGSFGALNRMGDGDLFDIGERGQDALRRIGQGADAGSRFVRGDYLGGLQSTARLGGDIGDWTPETMSRINDGVNIARSVQQGDYVGSAYYGARLGGQLGHWSEQSMGELDQAYAAARAVESGDYGKALQIAGGMIKDRIDRADSGDTPSAAQSELLASANQTAQIIQAMLQDPRAQGVAQTLGLAGKLEAMQGAATSLGAAIESGDGSRIEAAEADLTVALQAASNLAQLIANATAPKEMQVDLATSFDPAGVGDSAARGVDPATGAPVAAAGETYVAQPGDSLSTIAAEAYGDPSRWPEIYHANAQVIGHDPNAISMGMELTLPPESFRLDATARAEIVQVASAYAGIQDPSSPGAVTLSESVTVTGEGPSTGTSTAVDATDPLTGGPTEKELLQILGILNKIYKGTGPIPERLAGAKAAFDMLKTIDEVHKGHPAVAAFCAAEGIGNLTDFIAQREAEAAKLLSEFADSPMTASLRETALRHAGDLKALAGALKLPGEVYGAYVNIHKVLGGEWDGKELSLVERAGAGILGAISVTEVAQALNSALRGLPADVAKHLVEKLAPQLATGCTEQQLAMLGREVGPGLASALRTQGTLGLVRAIGKWLGPIGIAYEINSLALDFFAKKYFEAKKAANEGMHTQAMGGTIDELRGRIDRLRMQQRTGYRETVAYFQDEFLLNGSSGHFAGSIRQEFERYLRNVDRSMYQDFNSYRGTLSDRQLYNLAHHLCEYGRRFLAKKAADIEDAWRPKD